MYDLTSFQRDLLTIISGLSQPHGLAIKEKIDEYYETEINYGRLYPNLDELAEKGLVDKSKKDARTNEYQITRRGYRELTARHAWEDQYIASD